MITGVFESFDPVAWVAGIASNLKKN